MDRKSSTNASALDFRRQGRRADARVGIGNVGRTQVGMVVRVLEQRTIRYS